MSWFLKQTLQLKHITVFFVTKPFSRKKNINKTPFSQLFFSSNQTKIWKVYINYRLSIKKS